MKIDPDRRYKISEVACLLHVGDQVLRRWEERFAAFHPRRDKNRRRYYMADDIAVAQRIKELYRQEGMTTEGVRIALGRERRAGGRIRATQDALNIIDEIIEEARTALGALDAE